jgi:hypothetical protein
MSQPYRPPEAIIRIESLVTYLTEALPSRRGKVLNMWSHVFLTSILGEGGVVVSFTTLPLYTQEKNAQYTSDTGLDRPQLKRICY